LKIAFTGSHGVGKTTSVFELAHSKKLEFSNKRVGIFHENAAKAPKGLFNKSGTKESQLWIFTNQMQEEISMSYEYDILVCDRTVFDSIAYTNIVLDSEKLCDCMFALAMEHIASYDQIFFKLIKNNNYWFDCSHRETKDVNYRQDVENILMELYEKTGITKTNRFKII
jgi:hypothetical protein